MSKAAELLQKAERIAQTATTWADLSNALFDPHTGLLAQAYPKRADREVFVQTAEYRAIQGLMKQAMEKFGRVAGADPTCVSGLMVPPPPGWPTVSEPESLTH